jgi:mediator of RNA polymerase II transcription subunit 31
MRDNEMLRFFQDAEFAQALSNIDYVLWLAKQGFFEKPAFLNYLIYMEYLALPEYAAHLTYPRGLQVLKLLLQPAVRKLLLEDPITFRRIMMDQLWSSWGRKSEV